MSTTTIAHLIGQCKQNNQQAQMSLYKMYCKAMYNVAYRMVQDAYLAEDVLQEAFLSAFEDLYRLEDVKAFGSWLKRIVVYKSINCLRRERKVAFIGIDQVAYRLEQPEEDLGGITQMKIQEVYGAIAELKDNYRLLLTLHYVEGYDYDEIMEITGMSYANCRTVISRAKESLRKKLDVYA